MTEQPQPEAVFLCGCGGFLRQTHVDSIGTVWFKCSGCGRVENLQKLEANRKATLERLKAEQERTDIHVEDSPKAFGEDAEKIRIVYKPTLITEDFIVEQVWNRKDAPQYYAKRFDKEAGEYVDRFDLGEIDDRGRKVFYAPVNNRALTKGLVIVPSGPKECTFKEVLEKADKFVSKCYDAQGQDAYVGLLVRVAVGSWFLDRFVDNPLFDIAGAGKFAPIIPIRGPSESGKNRLAFCLRLLSYRPYYEMSTYRIPSLYRPLDLWNGTLILDEADFANTTEKSELIHFLNCRATGTPISRQNPKNPKITDVFGNFGLTIVTQRGGFDDNATESRSLPYYSEKTDKELPTVETDEMLREGLDIQDNLFYLRLKYYKQFTIDKTQWLKGTSDPRLMASLLPLIALADFEPSIRETIQKTITQIERLKVEQKANSEDGTLVNTLWEKGVFARYEGKLAKDVFYFLNPDELEEGKSVETCPPLTIRALSEEFKASQRTIRKTFNRLNLCAPGLPRVIKAGDKTYRPLFFNPAKFEKRLREFVVGYEPCSIFEKLGIQVTVVTLVTDKTHSAFPSLSSFNLKGLGDEGSGSVTSETCVTEKEAERP